LTPAVSIEFSSRFRSAQYPAAALFRKAPFPAERCPLILLCFFSSFITIELDKLFSGRRKHRG